MRDTQLTDEVATLKQLKRRWEDAKAQGDCRNVSYLHSFNILDPYLEKGPSSLIHVRKQMLTYLFHTP